MYEEFYVVRKENVHPFVFLTNDISPKPTTKFRDAATFSNFEDVKEMMNVWKIELGKSEWIVVKATIHVS